MLDKIQESDKLLIESLKGIDWPLDFGEVRLTIRKGLVVHVVIERSLKAD